MKENIYFYLTIFLIILLMFIKFEYLFINKEHFSPIDDPSYDDHQDIIMNDSSKNNAIFSKRDLESSIPTYAIYQPQNSGRHLNFFSHAPKDIPYYPDKLWSLSVQDTYFQPAYKNYFYKDGYFYPLY